jgi:hypothetical protein
MQLAIFFKTATVPVIIEKLLSGFGFACIKIFSDDFVADKNILVQY